MDLREIRQLGKRGCVSEGNKGDAVVSEGRLGRQSGGFLSTTETASGNEHASELAVQFSLLPEVAGSIPEGLPLRWEVTIASGDTTKDAIEVGEFGGGDDRVVGLGGSMHLGQNVLSESLGDPNDE